MAIIYTYPVKATPVDADLVLISDSADSNKTKQVKVSSMRGATVSGVAEVTAGGVIPASSGVPLIVSPTTGNVVVTSARYIGGANEGHVPLGGTASTFLRGDGTWVTPTDTTYTAGDGLDLTGTVFSTDVKANSGLVIDTTELSIDLSASAITGTLGVADGGTGASATAKYSVLIGTGTTTNELSGSSTNAIQLPSGTTAERPGVPANGMLRYNTTNSGLEAYVGGAWVAIP
jgi:hypothetical protein